MVFEKAIFLVIFENMKISLCARLKAVSARVQEQDIKYP